MLDAKSVIEGQSAKLRRKLLRRPNVTLHEALEIARAGEAANSLADEIESSGIHRPVAAVQNGARSVDAVEQPNRLGHVKRGLVPSIFRRIGEADQ